MPPLNFIEIETRSGDYRQFELHNDDITKLNFDVDLMAISAFAKSYSPTPKTVIGALSKIGVDVRELAKNPILDFRKSIGIWVSQEIKGYRFKHLVCVEIIGTKFSFRESIENLFSVLSVLEYKGFNINSIALPLLGAGSQKINSTTVISTLVDLSLDFLQFARYLNKVIFVVMNTEQAEALNETMNSVLGRSKARVPKGHFADGIKKEIIGEIERLTPLLGGNEILHDLKRIILSDFRSFELGGISRKLIEFIINDISESSTKHFELWKKIDSLSGQGIAQWIISYMHILRIFGNESVHCKQISNRNPEYIEAKDLEVCLFCIQRILDFYYSYKKNR